MTDSKQTVTHEVVVHKANLPLVNGESVQDFTQALSDAARKWCMEKLRMDAAKDYCYVVDVYTGVAILSCSIYSQGEDKRGKYLYNAVTYERDADTGVFTFSNMVEVQRVTTYRAKTVVTTTKSAQGTAEHTAPAPGHGADGWAPTSKALWAGVI